MLAPHPSPLCLFSRRLLAKLGGLAELLAEGGKPAMPDDAWLRARGLSQPALMAALMEANREVELLMVTG